MAKILGAPSADQLHRAIIEALLPFAYGLVHFKCLDRPPSEFCAQVADLAITEVEETTKKHFRESGYKLDDNFPQATVIFEFYVNLADRLGPHFESFRLRMDQKAESEIVSLLAAIVAYSESARPVWATVAREMTS